MVGRFPLADELVDDDDQTEDEAGVKSSKSDRLKRCRLVAAFATRPVVEVHVVIAHLLLIVSSRQWMNLILTKLRII